MKKRKNETTVLNPNVPKKLSVSHAASLPNQIRFYVDNTRYIVAEDHTDEHFVNLTGTFEGSNNFPIDISIKEKISSKLKIAFWFCIIIWILEIIGLFSLFFVINYWALLFITNIALFVLGFITLFIREAARQTFSMKSKHSAEHMMANFLETNQRLPQNMDELKQCSRFHLNCGSRKLVVEISKDFVRNTLIVILSEIVAGIALYISNTFFIGVLCYCFSYFISYPLLDLLTLRHKLDIIINPLEDVLTVIMQYANTTSHVEEKDLVLALSVANPWLEIVYPEFYMKEDDVFLKQALLENNLTLKVNNKKVIF